MKKIITLFLLISIKLVAVGQTNRDSLYQAKLKHPDTLSYTVTGIANFRKLQNDFEELRKKLAIIGAYDEAKAVTGLWQRILNFTQIQVTDPELYNPKNIKELLKKEEPKKK